MKEEKNGGSRGSPPYTKPLFKLVPLYNVFSYFQLLAPAKSTILQGVVGADEAKEKKLLLTQQLDR